MKVGDNMTFGGLDAIETCRMLMLTSPSMAALEARRVGDVASRLVVEDGRIGWGPGSSALDISLSRYASGMALVTGSLIAAGGANTSGTVRNAGVHVWTDRAFGVELHFAGSWATAIFTRASDGELRFGAYPGGSTAQNQFVQWARFGNQGGLVVGNPSGGDQGAGVVNAADLRVHGASVWHAGNFNASGHTHDASAIVSGIMAPARLGGGSPSAATYLRGDGAWAAVPGGLGDAPVDGVGYVRRNGAWQQSAWGYLTGTPTTLAGYGINDALPLSGGTITGALALAGIGPDITGTGNYRLVVRDNASNQLRPMTAAFAKGFLDIQWTDVGGKPASFTPTAHTHPVTQISDMTAAGRAVATAVDASAQRSIMGLGSAAVRAFTEFMPFDGVPLNSGQPVRARVIQNTHGTIADGLWLGYGNTGAGLTRLYGGGSTSAHAYVDAAGDLWRNDGSRYLHTGISHQHAAGDITSGILSPARLGAGSPSAATFLRGDGAWAAVPSAGVPFPAGAQTAGTIYVLYCTSGGANPAFEWRVLTGDNLI